MLRSFSSYISCCYCNLDIHGKPAPVIHPSVSSFDKSEHKWESKDYNEKCKTSRLKSCQSNVFLMNNENAVDYSKGEVPADSDHITAHPVQDDEGYDALHVHRDSRAQSVTRSDKSAVSDRASWKFHVRHISVSTKFGLNAVPPAHDVDDYFNRSGPWDDRDLEPIFANNREWVKRMKRENHHMFSDFKKGHAPKILWIGCCDARVPANEIIGEPPGSVFVHRNIANQVVNTDMNCTSVIQYAVDYLKVKHIIVCGHYDCGGVKAAMNNSDHQAPLENWIRNIRDNFQLNKTELMAIKDAYARHKRLVELNVIEQVSPFLIAVFRIILLMILF